MLQRWRVVLFDSSPDGALRLRLARAQLPVLEPVNVAELAQMLEAASAFRAAVLWPGRPTEECQAQLGALSSDVLGEVMAFVVPGSAADTTDRWAQYAVGGPAPAEDVVNLVRILL